MAAADHLAEAVEENTEALNRVRRRYWLTFVAVALVAVTLMFSIKVNYDGNISRCETGNQLRQEIDAKFDRVAEALEKLTEGEITQNEREFFSILESNLEPRDCSATSLFG